VSVRRTHLCSVCGFGPARRYRCRRCKVLTCASCSRDAGLCVVCAAKARRDAGLPHALKAELLAGLARHPGYVFLAEHEGVWWPLPEDALLGGARRVNRFGLAAVVAALVAAGKKVAVLGPTRTTPAIPEAAP
jgi:hypothetical protein